MGLIYRKLYFGIEWEDRKGDKIKLCATRIQLHIALTYFQTFLLGE